MWRVFSEKEITPLHSPGDYSLSCSRLKSKIGLGGGEENPRRGSRWREGNHKQGPYYTQRELVLEDLTCLKNSSEPEGVAHFKERILP